MARSTSNKSSGPQDFRAQIPIISVFDAHIYDALALFAVFMFSVSCGGSKNSIVHMVDERMTESKWISSTWVSSDEEQITLWGANNERKALTSGHVDFKPVWSPQGNLITFFRALRYSGPFVNWKSKLCVVGADGTGFRELSNGNYADFNPTWTRDDSNKIIFNRYGANNDASASEIFLISPSGSVGEEVRISNPKYKYEWAQAGLKDGRIFMDRVDFAAGGITHSFLLTPVAGGVGEYEEIARPTKAMWHKLSVSPSETRVTYMLDTNSDMSNYYGDVLYYADFDAKSLTVSNPVQFTDYDTSCVVEYPRWSADEKLIIYDSNCRGSYEMFTYRLSDGMTSKISPETSEYIMFGNFDSVPQ